MKIAFPTRIADAISPCLSFIWRAGSVDDLWIKQRAPLVFWREVRAQPYAWEVINFPTLRSRRCALRAAKGGYSIVKVQSLALSGLVLMPLALTAQGQLNVVPLKHWTAPPYWQLSESERDAAGPTPRAQSPANSLVFVGMTPCRVVDTRSGQGFA